MAAYKQRRRYIFVGETEAVNNVDETSHGNLSRRFFVGTQATTFISTIMEPRDRTYGHLGRRRKLPSTFRQKSVQIAFHSFAKLSVQLLSNVMDTWRVVEARGEAWLKVT